MIRGRILPPGAGQCYSCYTIGRMEELTESQLRCGECGAISHETVSRNLQRIQRLFVDAHTTDVPDDDVAYIKRLLDTGGVL